MLVKIKALIFMSFFVANSAFATLITLETRSLTDSVSNADLLAYWNTLDAGTVRTLDDLTQFKTGRNKINMLTIHVDMMFDNSWDLDIGLDAGFGAEVYVDGVRVAKRTDDLWWARNYNHRDVLSIDNLALNQGSREIMILWAEKCCDGASGIRFTDNRTQVLSSVTAASVAAAAVPEPGTLAMMGLGLLSFAGLRRRMR